jgi:hypothetical protein
MTVPPIHTGLIPIAEPSLRGHAQGRVAQVGVLPVLEITIPNPGYVVAGLVSRPVIGLPTSVGYGTSFQGLTAVLGMLNSCGSGVMVVNIDNEFGAAFAAAPICRPVAEERQTMLPAPAGHLQTDDRTHHDAR